LRCSSPPVQREVRVVVLVILVVPVVIGLFLLAMERLEFELIGTIPTAGSEDVLLAQWSGGSLRAGAGCLSAGQQLDEPGARVAVAGAGERLQFRDRSVIAPLDEQADQQRRGVAVAGLGTGA